MAGMNALRLRNEEKKHLIKYDAIQCWKYNEWCQIEKYLMTKGVKYWIYNGDLYTYDENFGQVLNTWIFEED